MELYHCSPYAFVAWCLGTSLTSWSSILLQKLIFAQPVKKFRAICGIRSFVTVFTKSSPVKVSTFSTLWPHFYTVRFSITHSLHLNLHSCSCVKHLQCLAQLSFLSLNSLTICLKNSSLRLAFWYKWEHRRSYESRTRLKHHGRDWIFCVVINECCSNRGV
jgi:hypothetical protein